MSANTGLAKVRGFILNAGSGLPAPDIPVALRAMPDEGSSETLIGVLVSDHAGYVSFDISSLTNRDPKRIWVTALYEGGPVVDLQHTSTEDGGFRFLLRVDPPDIPRANGPVLLASIQNPDPLDWDISPHSFTTKMNLELGEEGCEFLAPSTEAEHEYRFLQVVRVSEQSNDPDVGNPAPASAQKLPVDVTQSDEVDNSAVRPAKVLEYRQRWYPRGHSLGAILYSSALAPCESVNIAVIDWARKDFAVRDDSIVSKESLFHSQRRDRGIFEAVSAGLKEKQGGWSLLGGAARSDRSNVSAAIPVEGIPISAGASLAEALGIGFGVSESWGNRDLTGRSLQDLHDSILQSTEVIRTLNSTVIVQGTQEEHNYLVTRTLTNHNHCHALTMQFYEVLRHFKVVTEHVRTRQALLVPYKKLTFTADLAIQFRTLLEAALLDRSYLLCFEAAVRLKACAAVYGSSDDSEGGEGSGSDNGEPPKSAIERYELILESNPDRNWGSTWGAVWVNLRLTNGDWKELWFKDAVPRADELKKIAFPVSVTKGGAIGIDPSTIDLVQVKWSEANGNDSWGFSRIRVRYQLNGQTGLNGTIVDEKGDPELKFFDNGVQLTWIKDVSIAPTAAPMPSGSGAAGSTKPAKASKVDDECCRDRLLAHLNGNAGYYSRAIWLLQDPVERSLQLEAALPGYGGVLDPTPVAVSGNYIAYGYNPQSNESEEGGSSTVEPVKSIVALPTRGMFAETHLSHCNACEVRDVRRFWKWEESPCPKPPAIEGITPGPRGQAPTVEPGTLPNPVVQVAQYPPAPDPVGLAAAFALLGKGDLFRDMSGMAQVSKLVDGLVAGTLDMNQAKSMAADAKAALASSGAGKGGGGSDAANPTFEPDAANQVDKLEVIKNARKDVLLNDQDSRDISKAVLGSGIYLASSKGGSPAGSQALETVADVAGEAAKTVITKLLDTPELMMEEMSDGAALLSAYPEINNYLQSPPELGGDRRMLIKFDNLGGGLFDGFYGELDVKWVDYNFLNDRFMTKRDLKRKDVMQQIMCKTDINVKPAGKPATALSKVEVKLKLVVPKRISEWDREINAAGDVEIRIKAVLRVILSVTPKLVGGTMFQVLDFPLDPKKSLELIYYVQDNKDEDSGQPFKVYSNLIDIIEDITPI